MSLTHLLKFNEVKKRFAEVTRVPLNLPSPSIPNLKVFHSSYSLVGKAFDYSLRFWLEGEYRDITYAGAWIAEISMELLKYDDGCERFNISYEWLAKSFERARALHAEYLEKKIWTRNLTRVSLFLAEMDSYYRAGKLDLSVLKAGLDAESEDCERLLEIAKVSLPEVKRYVILNPKFGKASDAVRGADADFIIDNMLVDIKTTRNYDIDPSAIYQLVGYKSLLDIGGIELIEGSKLTVNPKEITDCAIYFSRRGVFYQMSFDELIDSYDLFRLGNWLMTKGEKFYGPGQILA